MGSPGWRRSTRRAPRPGCGSPGATPGSPPSPWRRRLTWPSATAGSTGSAKPSTTSRSCSATPSPAGEHVVEGQRGQGRGALRGRTHAAIWNCGGRGRRRRTAGGTRRTSRSASAAVPPDLAAALAARRPRARRLRAPRALPALRRDPAPAQGPHPGDAGQDPGPRGRPPRRRRLRPPPGCAGRPPLVPPPAAGARSGSPR